MADIIPFPGDSIDNDALAAAERLICLLDSPPDLAERSTAVLRGTATPGAELLAPILRKLHQPLRVLIGAVAISGVIVLAAASDPGQPAGFERPRIRPSAGVSPTFTPPPPPLVTDGATEAQTAASIEAEGSLHAIQIPRPTTRSTPAPGVSRRQSVASPPPQLRPQPVRSTVQAAATPVDSTVRPVTEPVLGPTPVRGTVRKATNDVDVDGALDDVLGG